MSSLEQMTEKHLRMYEAFGQERGFPSRRMELYMAQIAALIATTMGGVKDADLRDYLFDPRKVEVIDPEALKLSIGFSPRNKK